MAKFKIGQSIQVKGGGGGFAGTIYGILTTADAAPQYLIEIVTGITVNTIYVREALIEKASAPRRAAKKSVAKKPAADKPSPKPASRKAAAVKTIWDKSTPIAPAKPGVKKSPRG